MTGSERVIDVNSLYPTIEMEFECPICHNRVPEGREVYCYVCGGKVRPVLRNEDEE